MLSKFFQVIKLLCYPVVFYISQILIMLLFIILNSKVDINNLEVLSQYINENSLLILLIQCAIFIPIFYVKYRNNKVDKNDVSYIQLIKIIIFSVILSIGLNFMILFIKNFLNIKVSSGLVTFTIVIGTGILGPVIEELLFRGIIFERLKKIFSENVAFLLSVLIFALFHTGGVFQIIFAFIIGYYLTYIYKKFSDIRLSMLAHIMVNMSSIFISPLLLMLF